jgi:hypothetical protein
MGIGHEGPQWVDDGIRAEESVASAKRVSCQR